MRFNTFQILIFLSLVCFSLGIIISLYMNSNSWKANLIGVLFTTYLLCKEDGKNF